MSSTSRPSPIKTFSASSLPLALELVRRELGPEAVILETREVVPQRWQFWRRQTRQVVVTAGLDLSTPSRFQWQPALPGLAATHEVERAGHEPAGHQHPHASSRLVSQLPGSIPRAQTGEPIPAAPPRPRGLFRSRPSLPGDTAGAPSFGPASTPNASHSVPTERSSGRVPPVEQTSPATASVADAHLRQARLEHQLAELQQRFEQLQSPATSRTNSLATDLHDRLRALEMEPDLIQAISDVVLRECPPGDSFDRLRPRIRAVLEQGMPCAAPLTAHPGLRKVVALIGPSGVGKTTTLAKLGANLQAAGSRVMLISLEAVAPQSRPSTVSLAQLTGVPHRTVQTTIELRQALASCPSADFVLLDTAGRNPRLEPQLRALRDLLDTAQPDEVHLVLTPGGTSRQARHLADPYLDLGANRLLLTKLDEIPGLAIIPALTRAIPLPLSYLSLGPQIPDDLEHANSRRLARLALNEEPLSDPFRVPA